MRSFGNADQPWDLENLVALFLDLVFLLLTGSISAAFDLLEDVLDWGDALVLGKRVGPEHALVFFLLLGAE